MRPNRIPFAAATLLLGNLASGCGHFTGQSAFLYPLLTGEFAAPTCSPLPCRSITIRAASLGLSGDVSNFPLLVRLNQTNFPGIATNTEPGGADLSFANASGVSLPYEIEEWTDNTSGTVWVLVDNISSSQPTRIQMYYSVPGALSQSDSTAVFAPANGFAAVWHMDPTLSDATGHGYNGVDDNTAGAPGLIGPARQFDNNVRSAVCVSGRLGEPPSITVSAWVNLTAIDPDASGGAEVVSLGNGVALRGADPTYGGTAGGTYYHAVLSWNPTGGPPIESLGWKHLSYVAEVGNQSMYADGIETGHTTYPEPIWYAGADPDTYFGRHGHGDTNLDFGGQMDEIRVSTTVRSADWINLEFESQKPGSTLVSITP